MSDGPQLATALGSDLARLRASVADADGAYRVRALQRATRDDVVELALIRAMGLFDQFIGELFFLALQGKLGAAVAPKMKASSREEALLIVGGSDGPGEGGYVSWLPFKARTVKRARALLANGEPFRRLDCRTADSALLLNFTTVRNRVAHDSPAAQEKFVNLCREKGYPSARAADYLMSVRGSDPEILIGLGQLERIATGLADPSEVSARAVLSPEDLYAERALAPPGAYECQRSAHSRSTQDYGQLGSCEQCPRPTKCAHCGRRERAETSWLRVG